MRRGILRGVVGSASLIGALAIWSVPLVPQAQGGGAGAPPAAAPA